MENVLLEINDLAESGISKDFISDIVEKSFLKTEIGDLKSRFFSLSLAVLSPSMIRKHNLDYRKIDRETDVLSFAEFENIEDVIIEKKKEIFLGEILINPEKIKDSAEENGATYEYELAYIISHGVFHLLGMTHGEKMFSLQKEIAEEINHKL